MRTLRVALAQSNFMVGALDDNANRIIGLIRQAEEQKVDIVAFSELAVTGYPPEDLVLKPEFVADNLRALGRVAEATRDITAIVGFVDSDGSDIYNAAAIIQQGRVIGCHRKFYLPNYAVFDEQRYFRAGSDWAVYSVRGVKIGVTICEDIWYPIGPGELQAIAGAEVIVNINASPYRHGKYDQRYRMVATRALDELCYVCYLNLVGGQDELVFEGASMICDPDGDLICRGPFFDEAFVVADLDVDAVFSARLHDTRRRQSLKAMPLLDLKPESHVVETPLAAPLTRDVRHPVGQTFAPVPDPLSEIYGALVLGTRDYVTKSGFKGVVIALSGGIDSSLTAAVAVDALGAGNVVGISMPSPFSSPGSVTDSEELARSLRIRLESVGIASTFDAYRSMLAPLFAGRGEDITEENLQARIRGNILMALSNKFGWLVLTTGNKSEMAVGYTTLYGDLAGGYAVLKDVYKTTVFELARYLNQVRGRDVIPRSVIEKPPSAELRPDQRDEDSLPAYDTLDKILELYVEADRSSSDIVALGYDAEVVTRIVNLVEHSEYKRRQAPPGVKISTRAFGKDRRLPIANRYRDLPVIDDRESLARVASEARAEAHARPR
ncbi:MAG: NAD+ synthase [Chloroflexota bacterium]|nr:MAG: NAD+ synthase [Chloroflexota bacterium]